MCSCDNPDNTAKKNNPAQPSVNDSSPTTTSSAAPQGTNPASDTDSVLSQMKDLGAMFGKGDSGSLKNPGIRRR